MKDIELIDLETYSNEEIQFAVRLIAHIRVITKYDKITIKKEGGKVTIDFDSKHRDTFDF